jgi:Abnormal spindle-like microcephaly-assoc'd, ASPM-SPD-2-Hydin
MLMKRNDGDLPVPFETGEGLAEERITRARAIKLAGAMGATGAFALFAGGTAEAGERDRRRRRRRRRRARLRRQRNVTTTNTDNGVVNFGNTTVGAPVTRFVEVKNNGPDSVTLEPTLVGDGFSLVNTDPIEIASGDTVRIPVVLNALEEGVQTGTLRLVDARDGLLLEVVDLVGDVDVL